MRNEGMMAQMQAACKGGLQLSRIVHPRHQPGRRKPALDATAKICFFNTVMPIFPACAKQPAMASWCDPST